MKHLCEYVASDVMTRCPVTLDPHATLADAERLFERYGFNGLPVHHGEALLGVLTKLDLLRAIDAHAGDEASYDAIMGQEVQSVMTRNPMTVSPRTPVMEVLRILLETRYKSLPVVIGALLIGVIAREDVARAIRRAAADPAPAAAFRLSRARRAEMVASDASGEASPASRRNFIPIAAYAHAGDLRSIPKTCLQ
jgi:CBS domain-containing protein